MVEQDDVAPGVIEDGEVTLWMQKYNQMVTGHGTGWLTRRKRSWPLMCGEPDGLEEGSASSTRLSRKTSQVCLQLKVEDNPDQPGTSKLSIILALEQSWTCKKCDNFNTFAFRRVLFSEKLS